ncbi:MAG: phenylalanine--tRNA ligase subunit alpha [Acidobacteriota bacterium]|nr:phenylalanine--tRNA ligase subunit alpha [Acidobacteriota bacterium]
MERQFLEIDAAVLGHLGSIEESELPIGVARLAERLGRDQSPVSGAVTRLADDGLVEIAESSEQSFRVGGKAASWVAHGFPERRVARALAGTGGRSKLRDLPAACGMEQREVGQSLRWLSMRGWAVKERDVLVLGEGWTEAPGHEPEPCADELLVARLVAAEGEVPRARLDDEGLSVDEALRLVEGRSGVIERRERRRRSVTLTAAGRGVLASGIAVRDEVNEVTTELLVSGGWRETSFRPYDVSLPAARPPTGKKHPFRRILDKTRRAYLDMGFEETASPWVESAFWDFDALFQPQNHPARDMQDTFYVAQPGRCPVPGGEIVERVRRTHEDGGTTGSTGWRYRWSRDAAERCVLRTHTTSATVRELARDPRPPRKVFCVGPVYRREAIDYKHLPVFHQVDGIVVDERASFAVLLTLLRTFYEKMGFDRIQFRPAFFPYTEPSVEVFVWMESREDWVEMGGAGVFRAEVTEPLGCEVPVLAWGLGLERVAMFRFGLTDIRELYMARMSWLEEVPLCRS